MKQPTPPKNRFPRIEIHYQLEQEGAVVEELLVMEVNDSPNEREESEQIMIGIPLLSLLL